MTLTKQQLHKIAVNHLPRLGGFATALSKAYLLADSDNQRRIENAFIHLFERAHAMWGMEKQEEK